MLEQQAKARVVAALARVVNRLAVVGIGAGSEKEPGQLRFMCDAGGAVERSPDAAGPVRAGGGGVGVSACGEQNARGLDQAGGALAVPAEEGRMRDVEQRRPVARSKLHARQRRVAAKLLPNAGGVTEEQRGHDAGRRDSGVVLQPAARAIEAADGRVFDEAPHAYVEARALGLDVMLELGPARVS
jgi:hypothetical protein